MSIKKICHLADIHIRKSTIRNDEYQQVFANLLESLKEKKPDRIVIVGDLVHDYLDLQGEQLIMTHDLLDSLSKIAPVRITRGNHDCQKRNLKRVDSVKAIVKTLKNSNVVYYDKTGFYYDDGIIWAVWHHGDVKNNPWKHKKITVFNSTENNAESSINDLSKSFVIDLFHDPVYGCKLNNGIERKNNFLYKISDFKGQISMFGDIHKAQFLNSEQTKAYCGSLIAQDFSEGDDNFHGYFLWDIETKTAELIPIKNDWSFKNIKITPYTDFDNLDFEIENPTKYMKVRFIWNTLPETKNNDTVRKIVEYVKSKYENVSIYHKDEFIENDKIEVNNDLTLENVRNKEVQHEIFSEFLKKIGVDNDVINEVIALDDELSNNIENIDDVENEWDVVKFGGVNFMSYDNLEVDWRDKEGLFQITGINTAGKTTIMKLMSYVLFGKTLETETRMKYGDIRFINNKNDASFCEAYLVIESNGQYYGIKRRTEITRNKNGEFNGVTTSLNYYLLSSPDDQLNDLNAIEKLDEDRRVKTQKKIESIIGSYDNFMRIVMTTSDTLNRILSNDMAVFIDSLLYDSGLDIFDKKLEELKIYQKKINEKSRISCNIEETQKQNNILQGEINIIKSEIEDIEKNRIPKITERIKLGYDYVEEQTKKMYKIDPEIYMLNVDKTKENIEEHRSKISELTKRKEILEKNILLLKETYDEARLEELLKKKDEHKTNEYNAKLSIKTNEQIIRDAEHKIEIINGEIFRLKEDGKKCKEDIVKIKNSKICSQCGQEIKKPEHLQHIARLVEEKEKYMYEIANKIKEKEALKVEPENSIVNKRKENDEIQKNIEKASIEMNDILKEIGVLTNDKNDVEKRKEYLIELNQIPTKIQVEELQITMLQQKIDNYDNSLKLIEENKKLEKQIAIAKVKIDELENEKMKEMGDIAEKKSLITEKENKIKINEQLINDYKAQEHRDMIINLYRKCVHRDGIPRQMLVNYIIPKINYTLQNILVVTPFKVWLDFNDLRPKLAYNNKPNAIIDCISASGKERTFSSVVLKFALNKINVKAKPNIFLLDEVMGKLDENSVEEFIEILQTIKNNIKRVLVIEHRINIEPDYIISVECDENGISRLSIN